VLTPYSFQFFWEFSGPRGGSALVIPDQTHHDGIRALVTRSVQGTENSPSHRLVAAIGLSDVEEITAVPQDPRPLPVNAAWASRQVKEFAAAGACRTASPAGRAGRGRGEAPEHTLAFELLHLPDEPAGVRQTVGTEVMASAFLSDPDAITSVPPLQGLRHGGGAELLPLISSARAQAGIVLPLGSIPTNTSPPPRVRRGLALRQRPFRWGAHEFVL
jgi:hypothetical protein